MGLAQRYVECVNFILSNINLYLIFIYLFILMMKRHVTAVT